MQAIFLGHIWFNKIAHFIWHSTWRSGYYCLTLDNDWGLESNWKKWGSWYSLGIKQRFKYIRVRRIRRQIRSDKVSDRNLTWYYVGLLWIDLKVSLDIAWKRFKNNNRDRILNPRRELVYSTSQACNKSIKELR